ncbi:MAG: hypothetical protein PHY48_12835 [Candidatus Cloacimonetes bacterium]|nr:hypothetical protein [Candidatus Cloacimonadota bacterium]MDD2230284.1 hypothetical protein [Candidatus Cloacimonadota bacterium]
MILNILRDSDLLFQSDIIMDFSSDAISLSSVEYWSQESRRFSIKLLYTPGLKSILEGSSREIKAGFHTLNFILEHNNLTIFAGVLPEAGYSVQYYSLTDQSIEFNLMDYFGLLITLAADREHQLGSVTHPIEEIPAIINSCFIQQTEDERNNNTPAEVLRLIESLSCLSYLNAHLAYNAESWLPWKVANYQIYHCNDDKISGNVPWNQDYTVHLGLIMWNGAISIYFSHHAKWHDANNTFNVIDDSTHLPVNTHTIELYRMRVYSLQQDKKTLVAYADMQSLLLSNPLSIPAVPSTLIQHYWGVVNYDVNGEAILYSGNIMLSEVETVSGWYNAKNLLAEFLRISHAVLLNFSGEFKVINRIDDERPKYALFDPIEAEYEEAEPPAKPQSSAVAVASLAMLDATDRYYNSYLKSRNLLHECILTFSDIQLPSLQPFLGTDSVPTNPYDLINCNLVFNSRLIHPREVDYNISTGLISIRGWC